MYGVEKLQTLGFIDHEYKPTCIGWFGSKFRKVRMENIRMILAGYHHGANILDLITIACFIEAGHSLGIKKNKYIPRNPLKLSEYKRNYYYSMVFCDEFIEYLFIWEEFMDQVNNLGETIKNISSAKSNAKKSKNKSTIKNIDEIMTYLENWCVENKFNYDAMMNISIARDELLTDLLNIGLNPYYNGLLLPKGKYNLTPGAGTEVTVTASGKMTDGKVVSDKKVFRIKNIPAPAGSIGGTPGYQKGAKSRLEASTIGAMLPDFVYDLNFEVTQFAFKVPGQASIVVNGNKVDGRCKAALARAKAGDQITVSDIKTRVSGVSVAMKTAAPAIYEIQ
jgi:hypothetical protein